MRYLVSALVLAAGLAACAPTSPPTPPPPADGEQAAAGRTPNRCLNTGQATQFRFDSRSRVFVRSGRNDVHEVTFIGSCRLNPTSTIRINSLTSGMVRACVGDRVTVTSPMQNGVSCQGRVSRSLSDEQIAGLTPRLRP